MATNTSVAALVCRYINFSLKNFCKATITDYETLQLSFKLVLKASDNDLDILTQFKDGEIVYLPLSYKDRGNREAKRYIVNFNMLSGPTLGYPKVSKKKYLKISREYKLKEFVDTGSVETLVFNEHFKMFKDFKANSVLKEITMLTEKWNYLTSSANSYNPGLKVADYAAIQFTHAADDFFYHTKINNSETPF